MLKHGQYGALEDGDGVPPSGPVEQFATRRSEVLGKVVRAVALGALCVLLGFAAVFVDSAANGGRLFGAGSSKASTTTRLDSVATIGMSYSTLSDEEQTALFADFVTKYGKTYAADSDEYNTRLSNFKVTLQVIDERNQAEASVLGEGVHGVTKFADLTQDEFESMYLLEFYEEDEYAGTDADRKLRVAKRRAEASSGQRALQQAAADKRRQRRQRALQEDVTSTATSSYVDWSTSLTTPVNDQGTGCRGASWAFTAVQQIESDAVRKGYLTTSDALSVQQLLDCNTGSNGCTSGSLESAYDYSSKSNSGLLHWASQYPYINAETGECASSDSDFATTLGSYATVTKYHNEEYGYSTTQVEANMLAHLAATGTLSACMDGSIWNTYVSGALSSCTGSTINACVQIVGVYYDPVSDSGYYKLRNSWGTDFGESGYLRLEHGVNACNLVYNPGYTDPAAALA